MKKSGLLQAVCTVAVLAAVPAFAQSNNPTERPRFQSGAQPSDRAPGPGAYEESNSPAGAMNRGYPEPASGNTTMSPGQTSEESGSASYNGQNQMYRSSSGTSSGHAIRSNRSMTAGEEAVERLNEESLRAARQGQAFNASNANMGGGSGSMNDVSGESMNGGESR